jgi:hypothetical protein
MMDFTQKMRDGILAIAARPTGAMMVDLRKLGFTEKQLENAIYVLKREKRLWGFRRGEPANYFDTQARMREAKAAWDAIAVDRDRERRAEKAKRRIARREARKASGEIEPRERVRPQVAKPKLPPKPAIAATVSIRSTGRGPAYLPGEPIVTSTTKFTYGRSPANPTRTNTHSEAA